MYFKLNLKNKIILMAFFLGMVLIPVTSQNVVNGVFDGINDEFNVDDIGDTTPPEITNVDQNPETPDDSHMITISCTATDASGIDSVMLYYRLSSVGTYNSTEFDNIGGPDNYEVEIGLYDVGMEIEYFIEATDNSAFHNIAVDNNGGNFYIFTIVATDVTVPDISSVSHSPVSPNDNETVDFSCYVFDASSILSVIISYRIDGGSWTYSNMTTLSSNTYTLTVYPFDFNDFVEYRINATDASANHNFVVDDNGGLFYNFTVTKNDVLGPTITNVAITPLSPYSGIKVNITCTITDDYNEVLEATLHYRKNNGTWLTETFTIVSGDLYLAQIGPFELGDIIDFYISATDTAEGSNEEINNNGGLYFTFTVLENTETANFFILIPIIAIAAVSLFYKRRK